MQQRRHFVSFIMVAGALLALCLSITGCGEDDLYASCSLAETNECSNKERASCVEKNNTQCQTNVCAKYRGSPGFCTVTCTSDADCMDGACEQFVLLDDTSYCVAPDYMDREASQDN